MPEGKCLLLTAVYCDTQHRHTGVVSQGDGRELSAMVVGTQQDLPWSDAETAMQDKLLTAPNSSSG